MPEILHPTNAHGIWYHGELVKYDVIQRELPFRPIITLEEEAIEEEDAAKVPKNNSN